MASMQSKASAFFAFVILAVSSMAFSDCQSHQIVFVSIRDEPAKHLIDAIHQASLFNQDCSIFILTPFRNTVKLIKTFKEPNIKFIPLEGIRKSREHHEFIKYANTHKEFKTSSARYSIERFFYLDDFIRKYHLCDVLHLESDNLIYFSYSDLLPVFHTLYKNIATTFDNDARCIPSIVYLKDGHASTHLAHHIYEETLRNNKLKIAIGNYRKAFGKIHIDSLPIVTHDSLKLEALKNKRGFTTNNIKLFANYSQMFNSIFDAKAIGQFLAGRPTQHQSQFINRSSVFSPENYQYHWERDHKNRLIPFLIKKGVKYRINNLHIISKKTSLFLSDREDNFPPTTSTNCH